MEKLIITKDKFVQKEKSSKNKCRARGLRGDKLRFCVTDLCAGLPNSIEKKILKQNRHEKHKIIHVKRVHRVQCQMYADPHVYGFNKHTFNAQTEGDWVIYRGLNMNIHYRGKRFGVWVGPVQYGVRIFGQRISSRGFNNIVNIDGENRNLHEGVNKLHKGGFIKVAGTKTTIGTGDGEEVDFVSGGYYFNVYVRSDVPDVSGLCSQQFIKSHFFSSPKFGTVDKIEIRHCPNKEHHERHCRSLGLDGARLRNCVADRCQGFSKRDERAVIKLTKREKHIHLPEHHEEHRHVPEHHEEHREEHHNNVVRRR